MTIECGICSTEHSGLRACAVTVGGDTLGVRPELHGPALQVQLGTKHLYDPPTFTGGMTKSLFLPIALSGSQIR